MPSVRIGWNMVAVVKIIRQTSYRNNKVCKMLRQWREMKGIVAVSTNQFNIQKAKRFVRRVQFSVQFVLRTLFHTFNTFCTFYLSWFSWCRFISSFASSNLPTNVYISLKVGYFFGRHPPTRLLPREISSQENIKPIFMPILGVLSQQ